MMEIMRAALLMQYFLQLVAEKEFRDLKHEEIRHAVPGFED